MALNDILTRTEKTDFTDFFVYGAKADGEEGRILSQGLPTTEEVQTELDAKIGTSLTLDKMLIGNASDLAEEVDTITTSLSIGDFLGDYSGLAVEANWTNNFNSTVAGASGDLHFGTGANGTSYYAFYGQSGWNRTYTDERVTDATLIAALGSTGNWPGDFYNASSGDVGQIYVDTNYEYRCIDGSLHKWYRNLVVSNTVLTTDISYLPKPQIEVAKVDNDTFIVDAKYDIITITIKTLDIVGGNISIGSVDGLSDIVASTSLPTTIDTYKQLTYIVDPLFPTIANRTIYINIDSLASVDINLVTQRIFN